MPLTGMDRFVEARIQESIARGALDDLPGAGKPLPEDDLAGLSQEERFEALLARSTGCVPEVTLLREIAELRAGLARGPAPKERSRLEKLLADRSLQLSILFERSGKLILANEALNFVP